MTRHHSRVFIQQLPRFRKYSVEHFLGQPARVRVVATAMIRVEQLKEFEIMQCRMTKFELRLAHAHCLYNRPMSNSAERHYDGVFGQSSQFIREIIIAGVYFRTDRLVVRGQAFDRICDSAIDQLQSIVHRIRMVATRETVFVEHLIQQNTCMVAGERATAPVRPVHTGRQANDKKSRVGGAEWRYGSAVVVRIPALNLVQETGEPRAVTTLFVE